MVASLLLLAATAGACGASGDSDDSAATDVETDTTDDLAFTLSTIERAGGPDARFGADSTGSGLEGDDEVEQPVYPLTGMPLSEGSVGDAGDGSNGEGRVGEEDRVGDGREEQGVVAQHPALMVKVDNHHNARPPVGIDQADIVFDYRAEGVTRLAAVFHSQRPEAVGPVRSSRTADFDLIRGLANPLFAASGGNDNVMAGLRQVDAQVHTAMTNNSYYRDGSRPRPHNMFINPADLYAVAPSSSTPPPAWFQYRQADDPLPATATPVTGPITVNFKEGPTVRFEWDAAVGWRRWQDDAEHQVASGVQLAPANVVIMISTYQPSPADSRSPELQSTGSGDLVVLTDGHIITGRWERATATDVPTLTDTDGTVIALTPGQTFVEWPEAGQVEY